VMPRKRWFKRPMSHRQHEGRTSPPVHSTVAAKRP
jgi:hypothetical protein